MESPYSLEKGAELGRFELGSTVILLLRPGEGSFHDWQSGNAVRMGEPIGAVSVA
jgi:phosphatidylserine decarboxylase